jgi:hypothetical protein
MYRILVGNCLECGHLEVQEGDRRVTLGLIEGKWFVMVGGERTDLGLCSVVGLHITG